MKDIPKRKSVKVIHGLGGLGHSPPHKIKLLYIVREQSPLQWSYLRESEKQKNDCIQSEKQISDKV